MDFPRFVADAIGIRFLYHRLLKDENAKLRINREVADFEAKLALERRDSYMWRFETSILNRLAVSKLDAEFGSFTDFEADAPLTWKIAAEHLSDVLYVFCTIVARTAQSPHELEKLSDCLSAMVQPFADDFYDSKFNSWGEDAEHREAFSQALALEMCDRIELLVASSWQWYRKRLGDALDQVDTDEWMKSSSVAIPPSDSLRSSHERTTIPIGEAASSERRRRIDDFIASVLSATGRKITRKDIWRSAGYSDDTEFLRYQRDDPRTTGSALVAFERVLAKSPQLFLDDLDKKSRKT